MQSQQRQHIDHWLFYTNLRFGGTDPLVTNREGFSISTLFRFRISLRDEILLMRDSLFTYKKHIKIFFKKDTKKVQTLKNGKKYRDLLWLDAEYNFSRLPPEVQDLIRSRFKARSEHRNIFDDYGFDPALRVDTYQQPTSTTVIFNSILPLGTIFKRWKMA